MPIKEESCHQLVYDENITKCMNFGNHYIIQFAVQYENKIKNKKKIALFFFICRSFVLFILLW